MSSKRKLRSHSITDNNNSNDDVINKKKMVDEVEKDLFSPTDYSQSIKDGIINAFKLVLKLGLEMDT